ncbi:twin-arginine translocase subunit TatB, partial [Endobacter medicaginis]
MFDFSWSEIALVGGVALVLIGPKDLPIAMRTVAGVVKKARSMASEFQGHVDEMLREADLTEARDTLRQMRRLDVRGKVMGLLDEDGSLRRSVREATMRGGAGTVFGALTGALIMATLDNGMSMLGVDTYWQMI